MKLTNICTNCQVITDTNDNGNIQYTIFSYETPVFRIASDDSPNLAHFYQRLWAGHSATTMRHINKTLESLGCPDKMTKKEWDAMPVEEA